MAARVAIIGSGAIACRIALGIARSPNRAAWDLCLHSLASSDHARALAGTGLRLQGQNERVHVLTRLPPHLPPDEPASLGVIAVKAFSTAEAAGLAKLVCSPQAPILTLQNGGGNVEALQRCLGHRILAGTTTVGCSCPEPGVLALGGDGASALGAAPWLAGGAGADPAWLGGAPGGEEAALSLAASLLEDAGFCPTTVPPGEVARALWRKLVVNCSVNGVAAREGCANGALLEEPLRSEVAAVARETAAVARAVGSDPCEPGEDAASLALGVAERTRANVCSTLADRRRGAATEAAALGGYVLRAAAAAGVRAPRTARAWAWALGNAEQAAATQSLTTCARAYAPRAGSAREGAEAGRRRGRGEVG